MDAYYEFTRRISLKENELIETKMLKYGPDRLEKLCNAIAKADFSSRWMYKPFLALYGLKEGKISTEDSAFLLLLHAAGGKEASIFSIDQKGDQATLTDTFAPRILDADRWLTAMKAEPLLQRHYLIGPKVRRHHVSSVIVKQTGINLFRKTPDDNLIIASPAMHRVFFREKFGEDALAPNPCIGLSTLDDIANGLRRNVRDMAIPCPKISLPDRADSRRAPGAQFTDHDSYHLFLASAVPQVHRLFWIDLAEQLKKMAERLGFAEMAESFKIACIDMEFIPYLQPYPLAIRFWLTLAEIPNTAKLNHPPEFPFARICEAWKTFSPLIANQLRLNATKLGVDQKSLREAKKNPEAEAWALETINYWFI